MDKVNAVIAYMRKAGNYDLDTVREYKIRQCEAVVKGGRLLEEIAPPKPGPTKDSDTAVAIYFDTLEQASIKQKTAERWRAAGRLEDEPLDTRAIQHPRCPLWVKSGHPAP